MRWLRRNERARGAAHNWVFLVWLTIIFSLFMSRCFSWNIMVASPFSRATICQFWFVIGSISVWSNKRKRKKRLLRKVRNRNYLLVLSYHQTFFSKLLLLHHLQTKLCHSLIAKARILGFLSFVPSVTYCSSSSTLEYFCPVSFSKRVTSFSFDKILTLNIESK